MKTTVVKLLGQAFQTYVLDAVVVGSGCAGLNAADRLYHYGRRDIAVVTDDISAGTSRNAGSDKQTYYKLTLAGGAPDSIHDMAQTYLEGQCMDGEHALCEAALSVPCFLRLCELGVPFPQNRYGEYVGYKTDHDPRSRATSIGPLTSKCMTEALEASVRGKGIALLDHMQVIAVLTEGERACGLMCLNTQSLTFELVFASYIIYTTGGPAGMYQNSCYPLSHYGMSGAAFAAGAAGKNLTEWQYGLASLRPRWNVSGTYMQALPRFISTDAAGGDAREFLPDYLPDAGRLLTQVFLKGYQWPFDARKALEGSSVIDLIVYAETQVKGRRVFLDYRQNPLGADFSFEKLDKEARDYLQKAGALFGAPIDRLRHMNAPAVDFYRQHGVDLARDMLEIALCAQHNNGGIAVDAWWQSTLPGLFAVGEAAGTHGVYRPGGSALNAGQVGGERAARFIAKQPLVVVDAQQAAERVSGQIAAMLEVARQAGGKKSNLQAAYQTGIAAMSQCAAAVRDEERLHALFSQVQRRLRQFANEVCVASPSEWPLLYRYRDVLICQAMYLFSMLDYLAAGGKSRGGALYSDRAGQKALDALPESCRFSPDDGALSQRVQLTFWQSGNLQCAWRDTHPLPAEDDFFENVWRTYRQNGNVY